MQVLGSIASIEYVRAGKLRALAVTTATRSEALPDLPTIGEFVPGYEASGWYGIGAPKGTPVEISRSSTRRSMPRSPIPGLRCGWQSSARRRADARRVRQVHRRRDREVGQGDPRANIKISRGSSSAAEISSADIGARWTISRTIFSGGIGCHRPITHCTRFNRVAVGTAVPAG